MPSIKFAIKEPYMMEKFILTQLKSTNQSITSKKLFASYNKNFLCNVKVVINMYILLGKKII